MIQGKTILIVEDEKSLSDLLKEQLENVGFSVLVANNGKDGLAIALQKHPDLIVLDLIMPVMSGVSVIEKLKEDPHGRDIKIIVLSNLLNTGKLPEASVDGHGVYKYIVKTDIKIGDLIKEIEGMF
jgi:CheY-like chemotaxis protein